MNATCMQNTKPAPKLPENSTVEGIFICVNCGSIHTTILKKAIYCRECRNLQLFTKKTQEGPVYIGDFDDDD
jgi:DNA-directed RNA polymerase subunit RPC12/RpoP